MGLTIDTIASSHTALAVRVSDPRRMITAKDVFEVPRLFAQGVLAWTLPQAAWWPLSRLLGQLDVAMHPERKREEVARVEIAYTGTALAREAYQLAVASWANRYEDRFYYLKAWQPGGWEPEIEIAGAEHVIAALKRGRGIVFLGGTFSFNHLVTKMAFHRLGLQISHFSRPTHGFSDTNFGIRYLNAICRVVEDRYLGERFITEVSATRETLRLMRARLMDNGCVSFTVGDRGRRTATARFLNAHLVLATGPLAMAWATGATVLPVFTLRKEQGRFEVTIGEPIALMENADGEADYGAAVQTYADMVMPYAQRSGAMARMALRAPRLSIAVQA
jgi:lauroyl/myristoyl acyltransferase